MRECEVSKVANGIYCIVILAIVNILLCKTDRFFVSTVSQYADANADEYFRFIDACCTRSNFKTNIGLPIRLVFGMCAGVCAVSEWERMTTKKDREEIVVIRSLQQ